MSDFCGQIIEVLRPFAAIKISEQSRICDVVFPKVSAQAVKNARDLMDALVALRDAQTRAVEP